MNTVNTKPYHHGQLRETMVDIGVQLAAEGGPDAVKLREVARRAGVSPAAAYRHFSGQEELLDAVRDVAGDALRDSMRAAVAQVEGVTERVTAAGRGYFAFAQGQPLLFRCLASGFPVPDRLVDDNPFALLLGLVDDMRVAVAPDSDPADTFVGAVALWSAAHGISVLATTGALRELPADQQRDLLEFTLATAVRGLEF